MASLLTSVGGNEDKVEKYIKDCNEMGIEVLPPSVNESHLGFAPNEDGDIRFGLEAVKYVGSKPARALVEKREDGYSSFLGLCQRVGGDLNKESLESLIKVGAMDEFGTRKYLLSQMDKGLEVSGISADQERSGQRSFFDQGISFQEDETPREEMEEFSRGEKLRLEKEFLGVYISGDPLEEHRFELNSFSCCQLDELDGTRLNGSTWLAGRISEMNQISTRNGDPMAFITLSDGFGEQELVAFPNVFEESASQLVADNILLVKAEVGERNGDRQLIVDRVIPIEQAWSEVETEMEIILNANLISEETLDEIKELPGEGDTPVYFTLADDQRDSYLVVKAGRDFRIKADRELLEKLEELEEVMDVKLTPKG
jgi:DNA polymerase-3 subunit alpha